MPQKKTIFQLLWGAVLILTGIGVFYRIPQVMPRIRQIHQFAGILPFVSFCFYLLGALLIVGGLQRIYRYYRRDTGPKAK